MVEEATTSGISRNSSAAAVEDVEECLVCLSKFHPEDRKFRPCTCSFKICRFCWYRVVISDSPICPMCRSQYDKVIPMLKLGTTLIPRLEAVRQVPEVGDRAFDLINVFSYLDPTVGIPLEIFNEVPEVIDPLVDHSLIRLTRTKSKLYLTKVCSSDLQRCADQGRIIRLAMFYLQHVINTDLEFVHWRHKRRVDRYLLVKAYLPHALVLWNHVMAFDENEFLPGASAFFACLCERLDKFGFHEELYKVTAATLSRFYSIFGPRHLNTLRLQADLATAEWRLERIDKAMEILEKILPLAQHSLGKEHWLTMSIHNELAFILNGKGLLDRALVVSDEVIRISRTIYGDAHRDTLILVRNKAILLTKMGKYAEAMELFYSTYDIQKEIFGMKSLAALSTQFWIGQVLLKQGHLSESLIIHADVFEKQSEQSEIDESALLREGAMVAFILNETEQFEAAAKFCLVQSERLTGIPNPVDKDHMKARLLALIKLETELGKAYLALGKRSTAKRILLTIYEIQMKYQGPEHVDTKDTEILLTLCGREDQPGNGKKPWMLNQ